MRCAGRAGKSILRAGLLLGTLVAAYMLLALIGATVPANRHFHSQPGGVPIWVTCSEIHTDIVVPVKNEFFDWTSVLAYQDVQQADESFAWLALGWGDRTFYLETPTWADVKLSTVLAAGCGMHATAMHICWLQGEFGPGPECRTVSLSRQQYAGLCEFLTAGFRLDTAHRAIRIPAPGYTAHDAFYAAGGHYNFIETCNTWAGQALTAGGVRVGIWTPLKWGVLWQLN